MPRKVGQSKAVNKKASKPKIGVYIDMNREKKLKQRSTKKKPSTSSTTSQSTSRKSPKRSSTTSTTRKSKPKKPKLFL